MAASRLRTVILAFVALGLVVLVAAALTGLLLVAGLVIAMAVLNLVYLPRAARRLGIRVGWLALCLLPIMVGIGGTAGGYEGAGWGAGMWVAAIGVPRVIARALLRAVRRRLTRAPGAVYYDVPPRRVVMNTESTTPTTRPAARPLPPEAGPSPGEYGP